jgi:hypothetical protein
VLVPMVAHNRKGRGAPTFDVPSTCDASWDPHWSDGQNDNSCFERNRTMLGHIMMIRSLRNLPCDYGQGCDRSSLREWSRFSHAQYPRAGGYCGAAVASDDRM